MSLTRRGSRQSLARLARPRISHQEAQETYEASQHAMDVRRISAEQRKTARLNRARAAIARSISDDAPDGLVAAADELRELLADPRRTGGQRRACRWLFAMGTSACPQRPPDIACFSQVTQGERFGAPLVPIRRISPTRRSLSMTGRWY